MSTTGIIAIISSILLLLIVFPLLFFIRRRIDLKFQNDNLILEYPLSSKSIDLNKELKNWAIEKAYYMRWGTFYAIHVTLHNKKRIVVSSMMNQENYDLLFDHLSSHFMERKLPES